MSYHGRIGQGWAWSPETLSRLSAEADASDRADLPEMIGALEKIKATALMKLTVPSAAPKAQDRILTVKGAAERLRTSPASLYRKWKRLRLGYIDPLDGKLKFSEAALDAYIARQKRRA